MQNKNTKNPSANFKHGNDKFSTEVAKEIGIDLSNANVSTAKIIYAYELGLMNRL